MKLILRYKDVPTKHFYRCAYSDGKFFIDYYLRTKFGMKRKDITKYADEEIRVYFQTLALIKGDYIQFKLKYKDHGHFEIDIDSIR